MCRSRGDVAVPAVLVVVLGLPGLALAQGAQSDFARAVASLRMSMQGAYGDEGRDIVRRLDEVAAALGEWDRSIRAEEARLRPRMVAVAAEEGADLRVELGLLYLQRSRFAEALAELDAAARLAPARAAIHLLRGLTLDALERRDVAAAAYHEAWTLEPGDPVKAYLALRRSTPSGADLTRLTDTLVAAAREAVRAVRRRPGLAFFAVPFRADESDSAPVFSLARYADGFALHARGQYEEAIVRWREAIARDPLITDSASSVARMGEGLAAFRQGRLAEAITAIEQASRTLPASSEAHRILGTVLGLAGNRPGSIAEFEEAVRLRSDDERSWIALTRSAEGRLEAAAQAVPDSTQLHWRLAGRLLTLERNAEALDHYAQAARVGAISGQGQLHQMEAVVATMHLDAERTARALERRVRLNLNDASAHRDLAGVYAKQDRQVDALAELAIAAWLDPADPQTFVALGYSHLAARRDADAVDALQMAVRLAPDMREARYAFAQALTRVGRRDEGVQQLAEFERLRRDAAEQAKRHDALDAVKAEARRHSLAGQHRQAAQTWMKAVALEPALAQNYVEVADARIKAGQLEASIQYLVTAAELDGVADIHLRLSEVLGRLGRARESTLARETFERLQVEDFRRTVTIP